MRILWVGTKAPWPAADGGRLVAWLTLQALREAGRRITLVVPCAAMPDPADMARLREVCDPEVVIASPASRIGALAATLASSQPWTALRHAQPALRQRVEAVLRGRTFDAVHAEQPHALGACAGALDRGLPVVLRAHNVETDLWAAAARGPGPRGMLARREVPRVERWEGEAVRRSAVTIALSEEDAERLRALGGPACRVVHVPAPFPAVLEAAASPLPGDPAVVLAGSTGWLPNERGASWFLREVWPAVASGRPAARLHVFGGTGPVPAGGVRHPAPADSREAFAPGSVHAVPLLYASGVRMRILEAWARGVPVVATPAAAAGLGAAGGRELLLATTPGEWVDAIGRAAGASASLVAAGRLRLLAHHDPRAVAGIVTRAYEGAAGTR